MGTGSCHSQSTKSDKTAATFFPQTACSTVSQWVGQSRGKLLNMHRGRSGRTIFIRVCNSSRGGGELQTVVCKQRKSFDGILRMHS